MTPAQAQHFYQQWIALQHLQDIPLLQTAPDGVTTIVEPAGLPRLQCSAALVARVSDIRDEIEEDLINGRTIKGALYLVYRRRDGAVDPLYVGIISAPGMNPNQISALWNSTGGRFSGIHENGHVGKLTSCLNGTKQSYRHWVGSLFAPGATLQPGHPPPQLLNPVYVHLDKCDPHAPRIFPQLTATVGPTPLLVEEMHRIWVLEAAGYRNQLLNRDGI